MSECQHALVADGSDGEVDHQVQLPQRGRFKPVAFAAATSLAVSLAFFGGALHPSRHVAANPEAFLEVKAEETPAEETPEERAKLAIADLDKDKDGTISLKEWIGDDSIFKAKGAEFDEIKKEFEGIDKDKSGKIDLSEMVFFEKQHVPDDSHGSHEGDHLKVDFEHKDKDKDGMLSVKEYLNDDALFDAKGPEYKSVKQQFDGFDKDGNGKLNFEEFSVSQKPADHGSDGHHGNVGPKYVVEEPMSCPTGKLVTEEAECRAAANTLGYTFKKQGTWKNGYAGCMVQFCGKCQTKKFVILNLASDDTSQHVTWSADKTTDEWYNQVCSVAEHGHAPPGGPP